MNKSRKVVGVIAAAGLGLGVASAYADPQDTGTGPRAQGGMQHGMMSAMGHGAKGQSEGHAEMSTQERATFQEKMRNARTPEERQNLASANRTQMQHPMHEHGTGRPQHRRPQAETGPNAAPTAPGTDEHSH